MKNPSLCNVKHCRRTRKPGRRICYHHAHEEEKARNPEKYIFGTLRRNARRRGKKFDLTFEEFKKFAIETEYLTKRGKKRTSLTIDRIDNNRGYEPGNIRVLTNGDNVKKRFTIDYHHNGREMEFTTVKTDQTPVSSAPF